MVVMETHFLKLRWLFPIFSLFDKSKNAFISAILLKQLNYSTMYYFLFSIYTGTKFCVKIIKGKKEEKNEQLKSFLNSINVTNTKTSPRHCHHSFVFVYNKSGLERVKPVAMC